MPWILHCQLLKHLLFPRCELQRPSHLGSGKIALWETEIKCIPPLDGLAGQNLTGQ